MSTDVIKLNLVNQSKDRNNSQVLIFQKNVATTFDEIAVAWMVIDNLGYGWMHRFEYPLMLQVGATDSYDNSVPPQDSADGKLWTVSKDSTGAQLKVSGPATSPNEVQVLNGLEQGAISADIYRGGKLLATEMGIAPGQKAVFQFQPKLYIGVVSEMEERQVLNAAIIENINAELDLDGISSADIVMTGGGPGRTSLPFTFSLKNIKYR